MEVTTNYLGATLFWLYNVLALVFTGITLRTLYRLYQAQNPKRSNVAATWLFISLALVSFVTLSTNMLNVLIQSFGTWSAARKAEDLPNLPLAIWQWSITSSLFQDFGEAVVADSARFFWVQSALLATLSVFYYMGAEGRLHGIPQLWSFFCLSQILPISFAQNLFYVALLLAPETGGQLHFNKSRAVLGAAFYCLCLACAQLYAGTEKLVWIILAARAVLMVPLFLKAGKFATAMTAEKVPIDRATGEELQRIILKTSLIMTGMKAYQAIQEDFTPQAVGNALFGHPSVASLGCDFILSAVSYAAWTHLRPKLGSPTTGAESVPTATVSTKASESAGVGSKKDGKRARNSVRRN